jgi:hypothetical protein
MIEGVARSPHINADHCSCAAGVLGHWRAPNLCSPLPDSSLAGQEHGRTIPLTDVRTLLVHSRDACSCEAFSSSNVH